MSHNCYVPCVFANQSNVSLAWHLSVRPIRTALDQVGHQIVILLEIPQGRYLAELAHELQKLRILQVGRRRMVLAATTRPQLLETKVSQTIYACAQVAF